MTPKEDDGGIVMVKLPLDETTLRKLREVKQRVEVTDLDGRIVGYFEPSIYAGQILPPEPSDEELDEAEGHPVTYSLDEVWEKIHRGEQL
jgi:hypothetical protein